MPLLRSSSVLMVALVLGAGACKKDRGSDAAPAASVELTLAGVDTKDLTPRERHEWAAQVSELLAPCPNTPVSLSECVKQARPCKGCLPAARMIAKQIQAGKSRKEREEIFRARFDPAKQKTLVIGGSPELGSPDAIVTVVEWADFECPFCRTFYPVLDMLEKTFRGQVRVVFKFCPLASHPHGALAARAAAAAIKQGKFWEMHHLIFDNQDRLEKSDLERYAKQLGLDVVKFRADLDSKEVTELIEKDSKQSDDLGLEGTPTVFVNGRYVDLNTLGDPATELTEWVKLEIELAAAGAAKP